jgi:RimJ/RimL family protein N-acetyltransferase
MPEIKHHSTARGEITIRQATPSDAESLLQLRLEALRLNPEAFAADYDLTAERGSQEWEKLTREFTENCSGTLVVADNGDLLVGMTGLTRGHWPKTRHFGTLWGVYVRPDWRGLRIGDAIIKLCLDWAVMNEMVVVKLGVNTLNTGAIHCYTRCGFTTYATQPKTNFYDGTYYDEYLMIKLLDSPIESDGCSHQGKYSNQASDG